MKLVLLGLLVLLVLYFRFLNLNWDSGWGFHPDENNLWGASRRVELFTKLDPEFYAYGGFPIYLYSLLSNKVEARAVSAGAQTLIVILLFVLGKKIAGWPGGIFSAAMGTFSAGLIQAGHFLTVESLLGLFSLLVIYALTEVCETSVRGEKFRKLLMAAVVLGLGVGTKASFGVLGLVFFGRALIFSSRKSAGASEPRSRALARHARRACEQVSVLLGLFIIAASFFLLTNPFIFSKWSEVSSTLEYESKVAMGATPVFYTRQFIDTIPGWFQVIHVFPYITGWLFLPMVAVGILKVQPLRPQRLNLLIFTVAALVSFLPFWAKWTRYVVQVLPVLILTAGVGAAGIWERGKFWSKAAVILTLISFLPPFFYITNVYAAEDQRIQAAEWAEANIPKDAKIFTEAMDLGILPFNPTHGQNIKLFNFYELDDGPLRHSEQSEESLPDNAKQKQLDTLIQESEYFILLSRRAHKNVLDHATEFPRAAKFYQSLFDGSLGYQKIYDSNSVFSIQYSVFFPPEETFSVFDHPTVMIFQKK